jgi:hypothetical protein
MNNLRLGLTTISLAVLLAACAPAIRDAGLNLGGGGFYDGPNADVGQVTPSRSAFLMPAPVVQDWSE